MANPEHLAKLKEGVDRWNQWRRDHPDITPDLTGADLTLKGGFKPDSLARRVQASFVAVDEWKAPEGTIYLGGINLDGADLSGAVLYQSYLPNARLSEAKLIDTNLVETYLPDACLRKADLRRANLAVAQMAGADLEDANLRGALLANTDLRGATLRGCRVYGASVWGANLKDAHQSNLVISNEGEPTITVDDLEVAQFIYLLLNNEKIRKVIDTLTSKVVLILGRFTPDRKAVLDALRDTLRWKNYSPVVFDFEKPASRDLTETIRTLAHLARFVIADITDAKSIPQELMAIVPNLPSVPVQPLLLASQQEYGMFESIRRYPWVLKAVLYNTPEQLAADIRALVIAPAEHWLEQNRPKA